MLRFSHQQFQEFMQGDPERFVNLLLDRVRKRHPTWRSTNDMLCDSIRVGIKRARANGLRSDQHVSEFVLCMFEVAPNFDQQRDIRRILDDTRLPVEERWEQLFTPELDAAWEEVDQSGFLDSNAWFESPPLPLSKVELPSQEEWDELIAYTRISQQAPLDQPTASEEILEVEERIQSPRR